MKFTYGNGARPLDGYTIKRGVGHGGFGEVYYAVSDGGKEVALKLVQRNLDVELRGVAQCMNLKHPNLVTLYDMRTTEAGEQFVIMEFVSGDSLADVLESHSHGLPPEQVAMCLRGITAGIGYLHDKGIVHRDLKPGNIFIEDNSIKIGDYGLSKFITASRRSGQTESVGTVHYMAPEIARGKYDREIDVYALGIILFEMLTGDVPFDGESVGEILMKHLTAMPDVSRISPPYDRVVARALAKDPTKRFRTMEEFALNLNGHLSGDVQSAVLREPARPACDSLPAPVVALSPGRLVTAPEPTAPRPPGKLERMRDRLEAWWTRRWGFWDYVVAFPIVFAVGLSAIPLMALVGSLLPWALLAVGVILAVRALSGVPKKKAGTAVAKLDPVSPKPAPNPTAFAQPLSVLGAPAAITPAAIVPEPATPFPPRVVEPQIVVEQRPIAIARRVDKHARYPRPSVERPAKPFRSRFAEMLSAMLFSAVLSVLAAALVAGRMNLSSLEGSAILAVTCLSACWAVIVPGKLWESSKGDPMLRRLIMALLGFGVGVGAGLLDDTLETGIFHADSRGWLKAPEWVPPVFANAAYVALVFAAPAWWSLTDSRRGTRFNPWLAAVPVFWAWLFSHAWGFAQPFGIVTTAVTAIAVQLACTCEDVDARRRAEFA